MQLNRRDWLALTSLSLAAGCGTKKATGYPGYALIATSGEDSLAVLDLLDFKLGSPIPLNASPTAVVTSEHGTYALTPESGSVHRLDGNLHVTAQRRFADRLSELHILPDGSALIAMAAQERKLIYADPHTLDVIETVTLGGEPVSVDVDRNGNVAVSTRNPNRLEIIARGSKGKAAQRSHVDLSSEPGMIRFRFDGKAVLAAQPAARSISVFTAPRLEVLADLPLAMQPQNLCFEPQGGQLFITGEGMDAVAIVFPYRSLEVEQTVLAGRDPGFMACCSTPLYLFVASNSGSDLSLLDVDTRKVIGVVQVGLQPRFIAITPDNQYALIANERSGDVAIIRIPAIRVNRGKSGVALFNLLPVGAKPVHVAIVKRS